LAAIAIVVVLVTGRALRVGVVHASYVAVYGLGALAAVVGWATVDGCASWVSIFVESLQDLDLDAERLTVKQSLLMLGGKAVIQARKSKAALSPRNVGRSFEESIARAGVPKMRLHDLRHVNASLDLSTGTSVKAVAARLGHSDPSITLRTYAHVMPHEEPMAAQRLGALLSIETG
jgi:site-specific recombinase XerD